MSTDAASPLAVDLNSLPDDPALLKHLLGQLFGELRNRDGRIERLEYQMTLLLRRLYGRTSEKLDPRQALLFNPTAPDGESGAVEPPDFTPGSQTAGEAAAAAPARRGTGHGRRRLPDTLRRVELLHDLSEAEKALMGGADNLVVIGQEVSERLEWEPSCLYAIRQVRPTYARREQLPESGPTLSEKNVYTAPLPPEPIPGSIAGPGLLAQVIVSKYADHLPLHRLERIFARQGVKIARQTMCDWVLACAELLQPLYQQMRQEALASRALHTDDTPVKIRDAHKKLRHTGYFWTYVGDAHHPLTVFDYTSSHGGAGPAAFLRDYRGYVQADAAGLYDPLFKQAAGRVVEVGCWMHGRRKFFESRATDHVRAETALAWIGQLYDLERQLRASAESEWREWPLEERWARTAAERQQRARPILDNFHAWLETEAPRLVPKHPLREAMDYLSGNWPALCRYTEDGQLDIDNGAAERALRGIALGRRNWLFCGSDRGGRAAAVHFSLIASCHRHGRDPFEYLRAILKRLPVLLAETANRPTAEQLRPLLPDLWRPP